MDCGFACFLCTRYKYGTTKIIEKVSFDAIHIEKSGVRLIIEYEKEEI